MTEYDDEAVELTMVIPKGAYEGWELTGPDGLFDESLCTVEDDDPEAPDETEGCYELHHLYPQDKRKSCCTADKG